MKYIHINVTKTTTTTTTTTTTATATTTWYPVPRAFSLSLSRYVVPNLLFSPYQQQQQQQKPLAPGMKIRIFIDTYVIPVHNKKVVLWYPVDTLYSRT